MVQTPIRFKKGIALELRRKGLSYSEIQNSINLPRSTVAYWLKGVELSEEQAEKLKTKRSAVARSNSQKRVARIFRETEEIKSSSAKEIGGITKRELWLMGIMLYWKERLSSGNTNDLRKGIHFTSSDPDLIRLFLKWLQEAGRIGEEDIMFDIFVSKEKKDSLDQVKNYWSTATSFSRGHFSRVYLLKNRARKGAGRIGRKREKGKRSDGVHKRSEFGFLRIRVKASSMLARQIAGWTEGIRARIAK